MRDHLDSINGHIQIAFLPPYALDLNPVEYLRAWLKRHALANFSPDNIGELQRSRATMANDYLCMLAAVMS